ncbi:extracellular serine/threonine protein kinase FAM20C-like [Salvelinus fontinalis]|uniref:extracellular serine/threonine protein kinase FAM20C-like n=1 Tax=Salvelinus fontinalis TaxID=8038 RepID=UPI002484E3EF|nr:extracellular serine/threonine protein kinase FAM20C-like [Salvelinus fontinalis]
MKMYYKCNFALSHLLRIQRERERERKRESHNFLAHCEKTNMARQGVGRLSHSVCLVLTCLSLALHLILALFCLSVLQTSCVIPPPSSCSSSFPGTIPHGKQGRSHPLSSQSSSHKLPVSRMNGDFTKMAAHIDHKVEASVNIVNEKEKDKKLIQTKMATKVSQRVSSRSKLEALFSHPLYNLPRKHLLEDDWLLKLKPKNKGGDSEEEDEEEDSDKSSEDSEWQSDSEEDGYDRANWTRSADTHPAWLRYHLGISRWELYDRNDPSVAEVTQQMATQRILSAVQKSGGTQLKLIMSFPNYGQALLKPMRQERDAETDFNLFYFSDFERHNAEIAAFHLDRVLGFCRIPPVVGRLINITTEIRAITTDHKLSRTFFTSPVGNLCFHGQCEYYCSTENPVCGRPQVLEVSLASMLPDLSLAPRRSWRSPWRRSYSRTKLAPWEKNPDYCDTVKQTPPYSQGTRLVDLIDMVVLDFLMSNMDRHHYETFEKFGNDTFLLHLDNGRAFGRHSVDEPSILVPLQQCCRIRRSTLMRLRLLSLPGFRLSDVMRESLSQDPLESVAPLLSVQHLSVLDRRLKTILQAVHTCLEHHDDVIYDDLEGYDVNLYRH